MGHGELLGGQILLVFLDQAMFVFLIVIHYFICLICRYEGLVLTVTSTQAQMN